MAQLAIDRFVEFFGDQISDYGILNRVPGGTWAVGYRGKVYEGAFGVCDIREPDNELTPRHVMQWASCSKMVAAVAMMLTCEKYGIDPEEPVSRYIPELKGCYFGNVPLRSTLDHTSGMPQDMKITRNADNFWGRHGDCVQKTFPWPHEVIAEIKAMPHRKHECYSIIAPTLAGFFVANVTGDPYEQYVRDKIFRELGIEEMWADYAPDESEPMPSGHTAPFIRKKDGRKVLGMIAMPETGRISANAYAPVTGLHGTAAAMTTFMDGVFVSGGLLSSETIDYLTEVRVSRGDGRRRYGIGNVRYEEYDYIGHRGAWMGYTSGAFYDDQTGLSVVMNFNRSGLPTERLAGGMLNAGRFFMENGDVIRALDWNSTEGFYSVLGPCWRKAAANGERTLLYVPGQERALDGADELAYEEPSLVRYRGQLPWAANMTAARDPYGWEDLEGYLYLDGPTSFMSPQVRLGRGAAWVPLS